MSRSLAHMPALALALALISGCARVGPPTGGPADSTPPEVVTTVPEDGVTGVGRDTEIRIEFSEEMNRVSVERSFSIAPDVKLRNPRWDGTAFVARPAAKWWTKSFGSQVRRPGHSSRSRSGRR